MPRSSLDRIEKLAAVHAAARDPYEPYSRSVGALFNGDLQNQKAWKDRVEWMIVSPYEIEYVKNHSAITSSFDKLLEGVEKRVSSRNTDRSRSFVDPETEISYRVGHSNIEYRFYERYNNYTLSVTSPDGKIVRFAYSDRGDKKLSISGTEADDEGWIDFYNTRQEAILVSERIKDEA